MFAHDLSQETDGLNARIEFEFSNEEVFEHFFVHGQAVADRPRPKFTPQFTEFPRPSYATPGSHIPVIHKLGGYTVFGAATWGKKLTDEASAEYFREAQHRSLGYPGLIPASSILIPVVHDGHDWDWLRISPVAGPVLFIGCLYVPDAFGYAQSAVPLIRKPSPLAAEHTDWEMLRLSILPSPADANFRFIHGADRGKLQVGEMPPARVDRLNVSDSNLQ